MFRSSTIIRELALNLAKVIFTIKHSVKLRRYLLCGCVAACHGVACMLYAGTKCAWPGQCAPGDYYTRILVKRAVLIGYKMASVVFIKLPN